MPNLGGSTLHVIPPYICKSSNVAWGAQGVSSAWPTLQRAARDGDVAELKRSSHEEILFHRYRHGLQPLLVLRYMNMLPNKRRCDQVYWESLF